MHTKRTISAAATLQNGYGKIKDMLRKFRDSDWWEPKHKFYCQISKAERSGWMSIIPPVCTCDSIDEERYENKIEHRNKEYNNGSNKK